MVDFRITWTLSIGEECKAKTNYAIEHNLETSPTVWDVTSARLSTDMSTYLYNSP